MLCGAIWSAAPVSLRLAAALPAARPVLAALVMHALQPRDDDSSFIAFKEDDVEFNFCDLHENVR
ncbi:hypothetical protein MSG28_009394 [Choristoneura fumiferana]|uniref:Uncharacterized protein n=1 Tax=Choristoneura fumiferana TaxID=7141 RepID=A0ACC0KYA4_CHOFU|nr:hypothetical protein MSG28_009394 [Choristoneura fumiferana]